MQTRVETHYFERTDFGSWGWLAKVPEDLREVYELYPAWHSLTLSFRSTAPPGLSVSQHLTQPVFSWLHDPVGLIDTIPHVRPATSGGIASLGFAKIARTGPEKFLEFKKPYLCGMEQLMNAQYQGQDATGATIDIWKPYLPECESNVVIKYLGSKSPAQTAGAAKPKITGETVLAIDDVREYCYSGSGSASLLWNVSGGAIVRQAEKCVTVSWPIAGDYHVSVMDMDGRTPSLAVNVASGELWSYSDDFDDNLDDWTISKDTGDETATIIGGRLDLECPNDNPDQLIQLTRVDAIGSDWPINFDLSFNLEFITGGNISGVNRFAIQFFTGTYTAYLWFIPPDVITISVPGDDTVVVDDFMNDNIEMKMEVRDQAYELFRDDVSIASGNIVTATSDVGLMRIRLFNRNTGTSMNVKIDNLLFQEV